MFILLVTYLSATTPCLHTYNDNRIANYIVITRNLITTSIILLCG